MVKKLTKTELLIKDLYKIWKDEINKINEKYKLLTKHPCVILDKKFPDKWGDYGSALCAICGKDFGWYCPEDPSHMCDYSYHNDGYCHWCGEPDERK